MNRSDKIRAIAAYEALAKALRDQLASEARAEIEQDGTVPTWRSPGVAVAVATSNPTITVTDEAAFTEWVASRWPTEVEEIHTVRVRPAWRSKVLGDAIRRGDPPCADDGEVIPGCQYNPGGGFRSVSLTPERSTREALKLLAAEYAAGVRPLPQLEAGDE